MRRSDEGFRTREESVALARTIVGGGKPNREKFRKMGLDGVEYYDAQQLFINKQYDVSSVSMAL
jgi:hypothetical protein